VAGTDSGTEGDIGQSYTGSLLDKSEETTYSFEELFIRACTNEAQF
jgi:hypothetical protein